MSGNQVTPTANVSVGSTEQKSVKNLKLTVGSSPETRKSDLKLTRIAKHLRDNGILVTYFGFINSRRYTDKFSTLPSGMSGQTGIIEVPISFNNQTDRIKTLLEDIKVIMLKTQDAVIYENNVMLVCVDFSKSDF